MTANRFNSKVSSFAIIAVGATLALLLRWSLLAFESGDYFLYTSIWYNTLQEQGFVAFGTAFSNYTPLYLYFLYLTTRLLPSVPDVMAIKLTAIAADFVCAGFVYLLVRRQHARGPAPLFAFLATLFAPTVVLNSSAWGQNDATYTTALLATVYLLILRRGALAFLTFGIALAFKLQAVFLGPLLLILLLRGWVAWRNILIVPAVYLLTVLPAWLAGRPLWELLTIYAAQAGTYRQLAMNVPNLYIWLPNEHYDILRWAGLLGAAAVAFGIVVLGANSRVPFSPSLIVHLALLSVITMPYVLPKMHDRYFFAADVLSIVYAFYFYRNAWVPAAVSLVSLFAYWPYLFGRQVIPLEQLALLLLGVVLFLAWRTVLLLYPPPQTEELTSNVSTAQP